MFQVSINTNLCEFFFIIFFYILPGRPTEIPECDLFICTSMYDEINHQITKLPPEGMKKYSHSPTVTEDEIYFFPKFINPQKVSL